MELELIRTYHPEGTNGTLYYNGNVICHTIELPWLNNQHAVSCIPEGCYELTRRYSIRLGNHLLVNHVADRDCILIHPANDALKELKGCIAPVTMITGEGKGIGSRKALTKLLSLIEEEEREQSAPGPVDLALHVSCIRIYLTIKTNNYDH